MEILEKAKENMLLREGILSEYACKSKDAILLKEDDDSQDIRPAFFRDIDRIIHSLGYTRYIDKTQVYSFTKNDHITHRVLHVQLVSKIARTIGRSLKLNEDLIEAISLGHDIGHSPFGHKGESYLNDICMREKIGYFYHNAQSVRELKDLEKLNISLQTLDGILAHNGEILVNKYIYKNKTEQEFINELENVFSIEGYSKTIIPMTLEACVVRLSDIIAYVGRDIEDSIKIGIVKREDLPKEITEILGDNNSRIVDTLIKDIIKNSFEKPYLTFSKEVFEALMRLKEWNFKYIYASKEANKHQDIVKELFNELYDCYLKKVEEFNNGKDKFSESERKLYDFVNGKDTNTNIKRAVIDYMAGQTDQYFLNECTEHIRNINIEELYK